MEAGGLVRKTYFLSRFNIKTNILPRQARDKHKKLKKSTFFLRALAGALSPLIYGHYYAFAEKRGKETRLFAPLLYKNGLFAPLYTKSDHFAKTGSGQT